MQTTKEDPVLRSGRREALTVLVIWLAAMAYTVGYCQWFGYGRPLESLTFVFGFPDWIFWGVVVPWLVCLALSWWFSFAYMTDECWVEDSDDDLLSEAHDA